MAIATNGGHVSRAIDFYNKKDSMYFIIGGTERWENDEKVTPRAEDFKLKDVVGLKKVEDISFVRRLPDNSTESTNVISYNSQKWKRVPKAIFETNLTAEIAAGSAKLTIANNESLSLISVGSRLRIGDIYEGTVTEINGTNITLDTPAPQRIGVNTVVSGGALIDGAKYVYLSCTLNYDNDFPAPLNYTQIGLCTGVVPSNPTSENNPNNTLLAPEYASRVQNAGSYSSLGTLEILDNRDISSRSTDQRELISLIVEF